MKTEKIKIITDGYTYSVVSVDEAIKARMPAIKALFDLVENHSQKKFAQQERNKMKNQPPGTEGKVLDNKPHLAYIDPHLLKEMGFGMRYGVKKHGKNNHRLLSEESAQEILDATLRHLNQYLTGERLDEESQVHHLACVANNINFLYRLDRIHGHEIILENIYGETK